MATSRPPLPSTPVITLYCDACDAAIDDEPAGEGLYVWARGDEIRRETVPLCEHCATAIGLTALAPYSFEEEDG